MINLYQTARLHHQTVATYQAHLARHAPNKGVKVALVQIKVDPRVWHIAMTLAEGDPSRIKVRSATEVIVVNQSKRSIPRVNHG